MAPTGPSDFEWLPDPTGRHEYRLWDNETESWTDSVANDGEEAKDALGGQFAPPLLIKPLASRGRRMASSLITVLFWFVPYMFAVQAISLDDLGESQGAIYFCTVASFLTLSALVWWMIVTWKQGANPAKSLMGMAVVKEKTGGSLPRRWMFLRWVVNSASWPLVLPCLISALMMLIRRDRKSLADLMLGTVVVDARSMAH